MKTKHQEASDAVYAHAAGLRAAEALKALERCIGWLPADKVTAGLQHLEVLRLLFSEIQGAASIDAVLASVQESRWEYAEAMKRLRAAESALSEKSTIKKERK